MKEPQKKTHYIRQKEKNNKTKNISWEFDFDAYQTGGEVYYETPNQEKIKVGPGFVPHGGIILRNIHNSGFRMAYDIGVVGIYAFPGSIAKKNGFNEPKFLILGPPDFIQVDNDTLKPLDPNKSYDPILENNKMDSIGFNMNTYNTDREKELKVTFKSTNKLFGKGSGYLYVIQKFILTKYSDKPAHEPSGGLKAARLFPITQLIYNIPSSTEKVEDYVASFRVDYRLYINLDTYAINKYAQLPTSNDSHPQTALIYDRVKSKKKIKNAVGLFRDDDIPPSKLKGIANLKSPENIVFSSSEKPLVSEIITEGLNPDQPILWDNIHWWGIGKDGVLGSTPGSFHAVHIHWRWSKSMQIKENNDGPDPAAEGEPQFQGKGLNGALVDPYIKNQILRIAVIKNKKITQDYHQQTSEFFDDFFISLRDNKEPESIKSGDDIILYYSSEIKLKQDNKLLIKKDKYGGLNASVFIHGIFFAHEVEKNSIFTGNNDSFYKNPKEPNKRLWRRYPKK